MAKYASDESFPPSSEAPQLMSPLRPEQDLSIPIAFDKTVLASSLPIPDPATLANRSDPTKKSHARKQPPGHIPRPRNAFILFRCDFVRQHKAPQEIEGNHPNISRITGEIWQNMTAEQKKPWKDMAEEEKRNHEEKHPGYKYRPGGVGVGDRARSKGRTKMTLKGRRAEELNSSLVHSQSIKQHPLPAASPDDTPIHTPPTPRPLPLELPITSPDVLSNYFPEPLRRSSSCPPPGAFPVTQTMDGSYNIFSGHPKTVRDDLSRRPSRVTFYQSSPTSDSFPAAPPILPTYLPFPFHGNTTAQYAPLDSVAPPGWYEEAPQSAHWTQWTADVGKQFEIQAAMKSHDFDNSFDNTIPDWLPNPIPASDPDGLSFTNPFDGSNYPSSHTNYPPQPISPLNTSFMTFDHRPEFLGNSWTAFSADSPQVQLDAYRLPFTGPYHAQAIEDKDANVSHDTYQACFVPDRSQEDASGPSDGIDVTEELRKLVPRMSLCEDTSDSDTNQHGFDFMPGQKTEPSGLQGG